MASLQNSTIPSTHPATVGRPIVYDPHGVGFAELFSTAEHPAVAAETSPWWPNTVPSLHRTPLVVDRRLARSDRILLRRVRRELRTSK